MNLNDFTVGQTVYILSGKNVLERTVKTVGRKYITVAMGANWDEKFEILSGNENYLIDARGWGGIDYMFASREEIDEYAEKQELTNKLCRNTLCWLRVLSVEQLRTIKAMLDEDGYKI